MKVVAIILLVLLIAFGGFWLYGYTQPAVYQNTASAEYDMTPEQVWSKLHDHTKTGSWHPDIDSVVWVNDKTGEGADFDNYFRTGEKMRLRTTEYVPFERYTSAIADEDLPFSGHWRFQLEKTPSGTRMTIQEHTEIRSAMVRAMYSMMQPDTSSVQKFVNYFGQ